MTQRPSGSLTVVIADTDRTSGNQLRSQLSLRRPWWSIAVAPTVDAATNRPVDAVIVTMASGAEFAAAVLRVANESNPSTAKVALEAVAPVLGATGTFHRSLTHDADPQSIVDSIERSLQLSSRIHDPGVLALVDSIDGLPTPPESVRQLNSLMTANSTSTTDVAGVIASDPAMTVKLLQLVNSAFFGLSNKVSDVRQAVSLLGLNTVRNLLSAVELSRAFDVTNAQLRDDVQKLHDHSLAVATLAKTFMGSSQGTHDAFAAGMLHDIGMLAVISALPSRFVKMKLALEDELLDVTQCELEVLGTTHANIGAYLLDQWGLPSNLVEAVARSHDAETLPTQPIEPVHAVFVAEQLLTVLGTSSMFWERGTFIDNEYLEALGIEDLVTHMITGSRIS